MSNFQVMQAFRINLKDVNNEKKTNEAAFIVKIAHTHNIQ